MPYIPQEDRRRFDTVLNQFERIGTKGELEYCIFKLMLKYMKDREPRYSNLHDTVYAAMHCADEYRRRFLDVREDTAQLTNGDIDSE